MADCEKAYQKYFNDNELDSQDYGALFLTWEDCWQNHVEPLKEQNAKLRECVENTYNKVKNAQIIDYDSFLDEIEDAQIQCLKEIDNER